MEVDSCVAEVQQGNTVETNTVNPDGEVEEGQIDDMEIGDNTSSLPENVFSIDRSCIPTVSQSDQVCKTV